MSPATAVASRAHNGGVSHTVGRRPSSGAGPAAALLLGAGVAVVLGAYAGLHEPARRPLVTLGFSGMLQMKAWLTSAAAVLWWSSS